MIDALIDQVRQGSEPILVPMSGSLKTSHSLEQKTANGSARMQDQWDTSNVLKVSVQETICTLHRRGWSRGRIARELGIDRETVSRYLLLAKPAISSPGSEEVTEVNRHFDRSADRPASLPVQEGAR